MAQGPKQHERHIGCNNISGTKAGNPWHKGQDNNNNYLNIGRQRESQRRYTEQQLSEQLGNSQEHLQKEKEHLVLRILSKAHVCVEEIRQFRIFSKKSGCHYRLIERLHCHCSPPNDRIPPSLDTSMVYSYPKILRRRLPNEVLSGTILVLPKFSISTKIYELKGLSWLT